MADHDAFLGLAGSDDDESRMSDDEERPAEEEDAARKLGVVVSHVAFARDGDIAAICAEIKYRPFGSVTFLTVSI